jgi:hypothetical protein
MSEYAWNGSYLVPVDTPDESGPPSDEAAAFFRGMPYEFWRYLVSVFMPPPRQHAVLRNIGEAPEPGT